MTEQTMRWYSTRNAIMVRQLAMVLTSGDHETAVKAAKDAFALLADHFDPFAPETVTEEAHEGIKVGAA